MARRKSFYLVDDSGGFLGVMQFTVAASSPSVLGNPSAPIAMTATGNPRIFTTGANSFLGESCIVYQDGQTMEPGVDYTISPGGASFAVQTVTMLNEAPTNGLWISGLKL